MRILTIFGTRPEAIKLAPVIRELESLPGVISRVCVTGQHRTMLDQVLDAFRIQPDYDLNLMRPGQTLCQTAARVIAGLEPILESEKPDWVLVQGDTTTAAVASLAAHYAGIRVGHVEAGLRSFDKWRPFPEEVNRRLTSVVADLHFAPTEGALHNLLKEGIPREDIRVTGNTVIDALQSVSKPLKAPSSQERIILVTAHRRENLGEPLENICAAIRELGKRHAGDVRFVVPVHPNPNVSGPVHRLLSGLENVELCAPLAYVPWVNLLSTAHLVLTDSGGLQEEAPALGIPALILRDVTERPEGVQAGNVRLIGTEVSTIMNETERLLNDPVLHRSMAQAANPYGDGRAAARIAQALRGQRVQEFQPPSARRPQLAALASAVGTTEYSSSISYSCP